MCMLCVSYMCIQSHELSVISLCFFFLIIMKFNFTNLLDWARSPICVVKLCPECVCDGFGDEIHI